MSRLSDGVSSSGVSLRSGRAPVGVMVAVLAWLAAWVVAQGFVGAVLAMSGEAAADFPASVGTLASALVASWVAWLAMLYVVSDRFGSRDPLADLAVRFDVRDIVAVPIGVLTQLVVVPVVYLVLRGVWPGTFDEARVEQRTRDLVEVAGGASIVVLVLLVVVGAPVVEELVYRGLLQRSFAARISDPIALVVASLWFAVIHFRLLELPGLFLAGLVFGGCLLVTGRVGTAIIAHAAFNATALLAVWPT
ncbi:MAG: CPBP family intramembrane glutamic endopeptidase [Ilumatobacteraceae bacterium]